MKKIIYSIAVFLVVAFSYSCKKTGSNTGKNVIPALPTVTTVAASGISGATATVGGNVSTDGGSMISETGVVYSLTPGVTIANGSKSPYYTVGGAFSIKLTGLTMLKTYYYKAYAINEKGISYGAEMSFFLPVNGFTASSQVAATNRVAHWAFENGYIDSVSSTVGTPNHAASISFVNAGVLGKAVQVTNPGYINTNVTSTIAGLQSFTYSFWIMQPTALASSPTTFMAFSLNKSGYSWEQSKCFLLFESDNTTNSYGKICMMDKWFDKGRVWPKMLDNKWHHIVITFDGASGGALRVYIDGAILSQSSAASLAAQANFGTADSFTLGGPDDNAHSINGWMNSLSGNLDEFVVYNKVLTAADVLNIYVLQSNGL